MKKIIIGCISATALLSANMVFASANDMTLDDYQSSAYYQHEQNKKFEVDSKVGFTIGINAGYATVHPKFNNTNITNPNNSGFAWNANLGYQFSQYFAIESGYTQFANVNESGTFFNLPYTAKNKYYGIDLLLKGILPVTQNFNLFAKLGVMYFSAQRTLQSFTGHPLIGFLNQTTTQYNPEVGVGASYDVTQHIAITAQGIGTFMNYTTYAGYGGLSFKFN